MFVFGWRNCCFTSRFHDAFLIATSWVWKVQFPKIIPSLVLNMKSPSLKTNIAPENRHPLVFQPSIFRCYVSFRECRNMSDSFHPPRQPWKMSGFQITLCRTQLDFDAHFALKGCFHTFSRRWAVAKYFPQRPKGNRNLVPWINAIWWPRSPRGYVCEFERRVKWRCATFSYGSIVGWPTGKLIWCLLHYPKKKYVWQVFCNRRKESKQNFKVDGDYKTAPQVEQWFLRHRRRFWNVVGAAGFTFFVGKAIYIYVCWIQRHE